MMLSQDVITVITLMCLVLFLNAAAVNTLIVLFFDLLPAEVLGIAVGVFAGIFGGLGGVVGPLVLGYSFDHTGSFSLGFSSLAFGILFGSLLLVPVVFHEKQIKKEKRKKAALGVTPGTIAAS
jgi:sugar phosphate permease